MPTNDTWPFDRLPPKDLDWRPGPGVNTGGPSLSGLVQKDRLDGGPMWLATLSQVPVHGRDRVLAMQALQMLLAGGATPIVLPRRSNECWGVPIIPPDQALAPHSDLSPFSDGGLYASDTVFSTTTGAAGLRADQMSFTITGNKPLMAGEDFSIEHEDVGWRMYRIVRILENEGDEYLVEFGPNLRDDITSGTELDFSNPRCVMTLANPEQFHAPMIYNRWAFVDVEFEEAFW